MFITIFTPTCAYYLLATRWEFTQPFMHSPLIPFIIKLHICLTGFSTPPSPHLTCPIKILLLVNRIPSYFTQELFTTATGTFTLCKSGLPICTTLKTCSILVITPILHSTYTLLKIIPWYHYVIVIQIRELSITFYKNFVAAQEGIRLIYLGDASLGVVGMAAGMYLYKI